MIRLPLIALALLSLSCAVTAQRGWRNRNVEPPALKNFYYETWEYDSLHAASGQASFSIYLPKEHDFAKNKDRKYPWILWLPGFGGPDDFQTRGGAATLDKLRSEEQIPDVALVIFRAPGGRGVVANGLGCKASQKHHCLGTFTHHTKQSVTYAVVQQ